MSDDKKWLEELKDELRSEIRGLARDLGPLPQVLTKERAMRELSIGRTKLDALIKDGTLLPCKVGLVKMIPASEIYRLAQPAQTKARTSGGRPKREPYNADAEARKLAELRRAKNRKKP